MVSAFHISIDSRNGSVAVRGSVWEMPTPWSELKLLLDRLLAVSEVASVKVDRWQGLAVVHLARPQLGSAQRTWPALVRKIAEGLRCSPPVAQISAAYSGLPTLQLTKLAREIVGGNVSSSAPGRTRLQHPLLRGSPGLEAIVRPLLANHSGVDRVSISASTGTVLIHHAATVSTSQLLLALETVILRAGSVKVGQGATPRLLLSGGCLSLATVAEVLAPGLVPLAAGALVVVNLPTLGRGARELATFRWRLPALYTVIMGTTLVSGQVLAAAIMQFSIVGWYWWSNRRLRRMVDELLSSTALNRVTGPRDAVALPAGDEVRGANASRDAADAMLLSLRAHTACDPLIASLARLTSESNPTSRGHDRAAQFVPLTFATGAAAALTGDLATLAAVLRPDFATGPSIAERLSMVVGVRQLMERGWLVLRPEALLKLAAIDAVIILDESRQTTGPLSVESVVVPRRDLPVLAATRQTWKLRTSHTTVNVHRLSGTPAACSAYVRQLAETGAQAAVCGSNKMLRHFGPEAAVRISDDGNRFDAACAAEIVALPGRCEMPELWETLIHETRATSGVWSVVLTCNLASVAGAFLVGLTSLHVIALTNLGTWAAYAYFAERFVRRPSELPAVNHASDRAPANRLPIVIEAEYTPQTVSAADPMTHPGAVAC